MQVKSKKAKVTFAFCLLSFAFAVSASLSACGYQFRVEGVGPTIGGGPARAADGQKPQPKLSIPNFENKTFEPNLELKYTTYARKEFAAGSGTLVVRDNEPADFVLKGQVVSVILPAIAFTKTDTLETRVTVTVRTAVEDVRTRKVVWDQKATASSEYFITNDLQLNRVLETRALEQAGRLAVEDLATRFLEHLDAGGKIQVSPPKEAVVPGGQMMTVPSR
jgi:hypothetical protein